MVEYEWRNRVLLFILITIAIVFGAREYEQHVRVDNLMSRVAEQAEEVSLRNLELDMAKSATMKIEVKLSHLENLDRTCITQYIKKRYTNTPLVVAEAVAEAISESSKEHGVPVHLVVGVAEAESMFNPYAKSSQNARGVMQVMWDVWHEELNIEKAADLHEVDTGVQAGVRVLKRYLEDSDGNLMKALWMYNGKAADKSKYPSTVLKNVGRYILHECRTNLSMEEEFAG